jgi:putative transposase
VDQGWGADHYPQSNGKKERFYQTLKGEALRPQTHLSPDDARRVVGRFVTHYNGVRLHSAIGYVTPVDMLSGRDTTIHAERDRKLEHARESRRLSRLQSAA